MDFRSTQVGEHARIRDKTQSAGDIVAWVLHIFMQPLVCLASQVDPTPPIERPTPLINPHCHLTVSCAACLCRPAVA